MAGGAALHAETKKWMTRSTDLIHKRQYRIPLGTPYLEALVIFCSTRDEVF
jgi:hypothetical protein